MGFLTNVGLGYLNLARSATTLSGGESQRIRLATQIGSSLVGVLYILDEPSIGLHQRDNARLLATLKTLRDLGNTLIVIEHDEETMREADVVVDMGPGAGAEGGNFVAIGTLDEIIQDPKSLTGAYLSGRQFIAIPAHRRKPRAFLSIKKAKANNIDGLDVDVPIGAFTCVTGVSGSGKSTLVNEVLVKALNQHLHHQPASGTYGSVKGAEALDKMVVIDQSPIGRTPRSNPATYTGVFDLIRDLFAQLPDSKMRGYSPGRFSFNVKGGRCEGCQGDGIIKIEMHFLPDVYVPCEVCKGKRYNAQTLEVKYKGKSISDVLQMRVDEAVELFAAIPRIQTSSRQFATSASATSRWVNPRLSFRVVKRSASSLRPSFRSARPAGLSMSSMSRRRDFTLPTFTNCSKSCSVWSSSEIRVLVIEHNLDVIKTADYLIDLGPEGGDRGGQLVAVGTPEEVAENDASFTGVYLRPVLADARATGRLHSDPERIAEMEGRNIAALEELHANGRRVPIEA